MRRTVKEDLPQLIRRIVKEKKLKLREIESKSGGAIAQSYVSRLMTGNVRNPTIDKLVALARGLEIDPHIVFTAAHGQPPQSETGPEAAEEIGAVEFASMMQKVVSNASLMEIMKEVIQLSPEEYEPVLRFIAALNNRKRKAPRRGKKPQPNKDTA